MTKKRRRKNVSTPKRFSTSEHVLLDALLTNTDDICCNWRFKKLNIFELRHEISDNVVCATSKGSDQPAHMRSQIRAFTSCLNVL